MNDTLKNYLLSLLAKQDYSSRHLIDKAIAKGYHSKDIQEVLGWLSEKGFYNDRRMAESIIETYHTTKGKQWLQQKLVLKKIPMPIIEELLSEYTQSVDPQLHSKILSKYSLTSFENIDPKIKQKIINYIARQGFSNAFEVYNTIAQQDSE